MWGLLSLRSQLWFSTSASAFKEFIKHILASEWHATLDLVIRSSAKVKYQMSKSISKTFLKVYKSNCWFPSYNAFLLEMWSMFHPLAIKQNPIWPKKTLWLKRMWTLARFFRRQLDNTNHAVSGELDSDGALAQVAGRKRDNVQMSGRVHKNSEEVLRS